MGELLVILGLVLLPLAAAGLIVYMVLRKMRREGLEAMAQRDALREREKHAVWAAATVVSVQRAEMIQSGTLRSRVDLRLKVEPPGGEAYLALAHWLVDQALLAQIQPGSALSVKIDAQDPQMIYPNLSGAEVLIA